MKMKKEQRLFSDMPKQCNPQSDMHKACIKGETEQISKLLVNYPNAANMQDDKGWTPLYRVTICGFVESVKLLLQHNADPNLPNNVKKLIN